MLFSSSHDDDEPSDVILATIRPPCSGYWKTLPCHHRFMILRVTYNTGHATNHDVPRRLFDGLSLLHAANIMYAAALNARATVAGYSPAMLNLDRYIHTINVFILFFCII